MNELIVMDYTRLQRYNSKIMNWVKNLISSSSDSGVPVGSIMFFTKSEAPDGWLFCNGASISSVDYPKLYTVIGTTFGGDSSNFKLPDLRNQFLRGISSGLSPTTNLGTKYSATNVPYHTISAIGLPPGYAQNSDSNGQGTSSSSTTSWYDVVSITKISSSSEGSNYRRYYTAAVRPANMGLLPCIKY